MRKKIFLGVREGTNEKPIFTVPKIVSRHAANALLSFRYDILYFSFASSLRSQYFTRVCLPIFPAPFIDFALLYLRLALSIFVFTYATRREL